MQKRSARRILRGNGDYFFLCACMNRLQTPMMTRQN
nr:MAG TPA: hypothetical protein [Caudoviricetes sp.]